MESLATTRTASAEGAVPAIEVREGSLPAPQQQVHEGVAFPLILEPVINDKTSDNDTNLKATLRWATEKRDHLRDLLTKHGAILFRGFPLDTPQAFLDFLTTFEWEYMDYLGGGGPRIQVLGPVHTSTESPPEFNIPLHHELAYLSLYPSRLVFWCERPAQADGFTPIFLSNRLYERVLETNPTFVERLKDKQVRYTRLISDKSRCDHRYQRSWQESFATEDRQEAERKAKEVGTERIEWIGDDMQVTSVAMPAISIEERSQKPTWFNSLVLLHPAAHGKSTEAPWKPTYGDGSDIDPEDVLGVLDIMKKEAVYFNWHKGDVLLVDNLLSLHGRTSFTPPRRILAAIGK